MAHGSTAPLCNGFPFFGDVELVEPSLILTTGDMRQDKREAGTQVSYTSTANNSLTSLGAKVPHVRFFAPREVQKK